MFEELVRQLRACIDENIPCEKADCGYKPFGNEDCVDNLMRRAADAIEERDKYALTLHHEMMAEAESHIALVERLNKQIDYLQEQLAYWQAQLTKSMCGETLAELEKPRWVSVTEHFPDAYEDVLLQFPNNQAAGFCDRDGCWSVYSGDGFYTEVADNEPKPTHWAKKLPYPPKEET